MKLTIAALMLTITLYPNHGVVTDVIAGGRYADDVVTVRDDAGHYYATLADDLEIGDEVLLIMSDEGTEDGADDSILSIKYHATH